MARPLFDEQTFLGYRVNTRLFWIVFTLMMVFFTSPVAHFPFFFGYDPMVAVLAGLFALAVNVLVPLYVAHRSWRSSAAEKAD